MTNKTTGRRRAEDEAAWWHQPDGVFNEESAREGSAISGWEAHDAALSTRRGASKRKSVLGRPGKRRRGGGTVVGDPEEDDAVTFEDYKPVRPVRHQQPPPAAGKHERGTPFDLLHSLRPDKIMHVEESHPLVETMRGARPSIGNDWPSQR